MGTQLIDLNKDPKNEAIHQTKSRYTATQHPNKVNF